MNKLINIKAVESITGISQHVIRAWENRYKAVEPIRTDSNHRMYSDDQITKLELLKKLTDNGYAIGRIAHLSIHELSEHLTNIKPEYHFEPMGSASPSFQDIIDSCIAYTMLYKAQEIQETLEVAVHEYGQFVFLREVIEPLLVKVGELWAKGEMRVSHEHFIAAVIKQTLNNLVSSNKTTSDAKSIVLATTSGELHEMGCLMGAVIASSFGLRTIYLGTSLPAEEIIFSTQKNKSIIVFLGVVYPIHKDETIEIIKKIKQYTSLNCNVIVAGNINTLSHFTELEEIDRIHLIKSQEEFIQFLQSISGQI